MFARSRRLAIALLLIGSLAFSAACSGDDSPSSDGAPSDNGGSDTSANSADLRLLGTDPLTLDPAKVFETSSAPYVLEIFGGLVTIDRNLQVVPDIAETIDLSEDGTVYTFHLRRDALFHDGRPVTAADFEYSLNRAAQLGATGESITAGAFLGDIVGAKDVVNGRTETISGIEVIDSETLQITIDAPKPYFLAKLSYPTAFVVDQQEVESNPRNWTRKPNGTGPYELAEWRVNERIILEANPRYHLGAPSVERVFYNLAGGSSLTQYEAGEIDVSGISRFDIERVQSDRDELSADYKTGSNLSVGYIGFNTNAPPFDDVHVRRAFAMAVDRELLSNTIQKGMFPLANSFMMPGLPGYNESAKLPAFDPEAAKAELAMSKYGSAEGLGDVVLTIAGGGATGNTDTDAIIEMWKQNLGVDVTIEQAETATFFDNVQRGRTQMWTAGWIMDYPDPENLLDLHFYSASRNNDSRYSNPTFDGLMEQARTEADTAKRLEIYQEAEGILIEELPWLPLSYGTDHFVVKPYVKGYEPLPMLIPQLRYVTIEK